MVRHPRLEQRVAAQHVQRHAVHLGGQGRRAVAPGEGVQPRDAAHAWTARSPSAAVEFMTRSRERAQAVLPLRAVHAHPFPDAAASRFRREDRRRRHRRRDGGDGPQRGRRPRRDRAARHRAQHDRDLGSDGGAEARRPWRGTAGPWRGFYNTAMEGGIRTPFMIRWPGRIPAGQRLERDRARHGRLPDARARRRRRRCRRIAPSTASNQLPFFEGKQEQVEPRQLHLLRAGQSGARGQVAATGSCTTSGRTSRRSRSTAR